MYPSSRPRRDTTLPSALFFAVILNSIQDLVFNLVISTAGRNPSFVFIPPLEKGEGDLILLLFIFVIPECLYRESSLLISHCEGAQHPRQSFFPYLKPPRKHTSPTLITIWNHSEINQEGTDRHKKNREDVLSLGFLCAYREGRCSPIAI